MFNRLNKLVKVRQIVWLAFALFGLLLFKDIFSQRTLVPNLEPFPDTFHYLVPAINTVKGEGFTLSRGFGAARISVSPLYSLFLVPFYLISLQPQMYYLLNVILSLTSLYLFFKIIALLTKNKWIIGLLLLIFTTNYYMYWYPQWAMAENLLLPLFLLLIYLIVSKKYKSRLFLTGLLTCCIFATKYAYLGLMGGFIIIFGYLVLIGKDKIKNTLYFVSGFLVVFIPVFIYRQNTHTLAFLLESIKNIFFVGGSSESIVSSTKYFSYLYVQDNLPSYLKALLGEQIRVLWDFTSLVPKWLAIISGVGIASALFTRKFRMLAIFLLILLFSQIVFISNFYSLDGRFVLHSVPLLFLGVCLALLVVKERTKSKGIVFFVVLVIGMVYLFQNGLRIKDQIVLNMRYAETPWNYVAVLKLNQYFTGKSFKHEPVIISPHPPFLIDMYTTFDYHLLPLSLDQDFRFEWERVWGPDDYTDLILLYRGYLEQGREVYVTTYGLGNVTYLHNALREIEENFQISEVSNECYSQCKIFKLSIK